jgi:hypothetical protein
MTTLPQSFIFYYLAPSMVADNTSAIVQEYSCKKALDYFI